MLNEDSLEILKEELNEEVLSSMPQWFRILRDGYRKMKKQKTDLDFPIIEFVQQLLKNLWILNKYGHQLVSFRSHLI